MLGQDGSCITPERRYYQQAVIINKSEIQEFKINKTDFSQENPQFDYSVEFILKQGKKGYLFKGADSGNLYSGTFDKSTGTLSYPQYKHNVNLAIIGASIASKYILESLDKGLYVAAMQFTDGTIEIYGIENGLKTGDYTYDIQGGGGGSTIVLCSAENSQESNLPLVYKSKVTAGESADFDSLFENTTTSK